MLNRTWPGRGADHRLHRRAAHHGRRRQRPKAPWTPATCSNPPWRAASCTASARPRWTNTASTSRRTPPWSAGSRRSWWASPRWKPTIAILRGLQGALPGAPRRGDHRPGHRGRGRAVHRYITDRFLPDKAIDLIDEAASKIKIETRLQARGHGQTRPPPDPAADRARSR